MDKGKSLLKSYTFHTSRPKERGIKEVRVKILQIVFEPEGLFVIY
jgi:hypothetical protein